ncbi:hypothetical protein KIN20_026060 [Parelaphostrongylus tenuis]|uniref:Uncharacterized protein n=1 Tax=Parelaphostrongylus tenuis TaxID=148309 RepID=A0AAD5MW61_PARTN|nr:hypothetical protein KIN20_026060 [Parelaphostrongylus tenuis]
MDDELSICIIVYQTPTIGSRHALDSMKLVQSFECTSGSYSTLQSSTDVNQCSILRDRLSAPEGSEAMVKPVCEVDRAVNSVC